MDMKTPTATQIETLRTIVAEYDAAALNERVRWGKELTGGIAASRNATGYRSVHALIDLGMLTFASHIESHETLRKGSWGKRLGGTRQHRSVVLVVKPTAAARAFLAT